MKKCSILVLLLAIVIVRAQPASVEVVAGNRNYWYQHSIAKQAEKSRPGFSNTSSLYFFYESHAVEVMNQSYLTFKLNRAFKLSAGTFYATATGLKPSINLQFTQGGKDWLLLIVPRIDIHTNSSHDLFLLFEYKPRVTENISVYLRVQAMTNYTGKTHNRSYQLLRAGLSLKSMQFGAAVSFDAFGSEIKYYSNYGVFLRKYFP